MPALSKENGATLKDLHIYFLYVVRASANNAVGEGPKSTEVKARAVESGDNVVHLHGPHDLYVSVIFRSLKS